jgi:hypothetical protein
MSVTGESKTAAATGGVARTLRALGALLRGTVGAVSLVGGVTWLLLSNSGPLLSVDVLLGLVLAAGGTVLLLPHRIQLPPLTSALAVGGAALLGTAAGLTSTAAKLCCGYVHAEARGFPARWQARGGIADNAVTARRLAEASDWHVDALRLAVDLLFWGYVGLLAMLAVFAARWALRKGWRRRTVG